MPLNARQFVKAVGAGLHLPPGGWTAQSFAAHGQALVLTTARVAQITQRRAIPVLARASLNVFNRQLAAVIKYATGAEARLSQRSAKAPLTIDLEFPAHEGLWLEAIDQVFKEANLDIVTELMPPIQSVMGQGYSKVSILLGQDWQDNNATIAREARNIAQRVVQVNNTTKNNIANSIKDSIKAGQTVSETARQLEERVPKIFGNRALTVARTELNNAWTEGAMTAFKASETLTHISVIGCEAREPSSPQYNGQSTCNYPDLPVIEIDQFMEVGFHPNHTGNVVPSGFRD